MRQKAVTSQTSLATEAIIKRPDIPTEIRGCFRRSLGCATSGEDMLWREVAARLTLDALGILTSATAPYEGMDRSQFHRYKRDVEQARHWFLHQKIDCVEVFAMGNVDLDPVVHVVKLLPPVRVPTVLASKKTVKKEIRDDSLAVAA